MADRSDVLAAPEAERALVGAVLIEPSIATKLLDQVGSGDFYDTRHETLWDTYAACVKDGTDPDLVTVTDRLRRHKQTDLMAYLPDLVNPAVSLSQVDYYAATIVDYSARRKLQALGTRLVQAAVTATDPVIAYGNASDEIDAAAVNFMGGPVAKLSPRYVDLSWLLSGQAPDIPAPGWVIRDDGIGLFYTGRVNGIYGDPDTAKTWLAMLGIVQALANGRRAGLVDLDHNGQDETIKRLLLLGASHHDLADPDRFRYYEPGDDVDLIESVADQLAFEPAVTVLDSLGEIIPMLGGKSTDNDDVTNALRRTAVPLAAADCCVIAIDHLPKSKEARQSGYAIAATAKKRIINGAYLEAKAIPGSEPAPGRVGRIILSVSKDRSGGLLQHSIKKYAGLLLLDSTSTEQVVARIRVGDRAPDPTETPLEPIMAMVTTYLKDAGTPQSGNQIRLGLRGKAGSDRDVIAACNRLIEDGHVTTTRGKGRAILHHLVSLFEPGEEDP